MAAPMHADIKAIAFDGFPIFDPKSVLSLTKTLFPEHAKVFAKAWFNKIFAYTWLRTTGNRYKNFYAVIEDALVFTATQFKVELNADRRDQLMAAWLHLKPWSDAVSARRFVAHAWHRKPLQFLADPASACGLCRVPNQKYCHHQWHKNDAQYFAYTKIDADAKRMRQRNNHPDQ